MKSLKDEIKLLTEAVKRIDNIDILLETIAELDYLKSLRECSVKQFGQRTLKIGNEIDIRKKIDRYRKKIEDLEND